MSSTDPANSAKTRLRILTYVTPEVPITIFTMLRDCIEEVTEMEVDLMVEDRFPGPSPSRTNPFSADLADIVIMHSTDYLRLKVHKQDHMELCRAAPVHKHPLVTDRPIYFSEIIINSANKEKYKSIQDLRGCSWAYNNDSSLSGNLVVLDYLKKHLKTNAAHFGNIILSGSHLNSIKMVRDFRVEAAAVDSTVLAGYLLEHEDHHDKFTSVESLGPLPIYPFLFNSRLSARLKHKITDMLLSLTKSPKWAVQLNDLGILRFVPVEPEFYHLEDDIVKGTLGLSISATYY
ncbi:uncharacterized protein LOC131936243 [Physella acuta]|uniref:uncharacterized protein LOC131936243 n=1 Tax=Physella acuta TaxID=109671 RepID=UPI0027DB7527|nr:uncharacterized protein LOC131936243 [Physella acuta]